ncbi:unnamed protein product [Rotaria socialis]|uniref:Uncharacterized protein n=1 Tax=Rotaria socialis TaxID=392032 RepID=A0A820WVF1_9BILA|nr:unnamed protein product [Rotaria socialis]
MHLVCLGHVESIIKRWCKIIDKVDLLQIDHMLHSAQYPHNEHVTYTESILAVESWKAKHSRLFVLYLGVPIGSLTEIEAAADRLDKEMNTDLESDCEIVMNFDKSNASQELSQYSMVATPSSKSSIEIVGSSAIRKNKNQKEKENNPTGSTMRSLLMTSFDNTTTTYEMPQISEKIVQKKIEQQTSRKKGKYCTP